VARPNENRALQRSVKALSRSIYCWHIVIYPTNPTVGRPETVAIRSATAGIEPCGCELPANRADIAKCCRAHPSAGQSSPRESYCEKGTPFNELGLMTLPRTIERLIDAQGGGRRSHPDQRLFVVTPVAGESCCASELYAQFDWIPPAGGVHQRKMVSGSC